MGQIPTTQPADTSELSDLRSEVVKLRKNLAELQAEYAVLKSAHPASSAEKDRQIQQLQATLVLQARQIESLQGEIADLKSSKADSTHSIPGKSPTTLPATRPAVKAIPPQKVLEKVIADISFDQSPFAHCVDFLRDISGANIIVNDRALEGAGINRNFPISAKLHQVRLDKALDTLLNSIQVNGARLGYTIDNDAILISTTTDLDRYTVVKTYDIRSLLPHDHASHAEAVDRIKKVIMDTVAPDSWRDNGGIVGTIRELNGTLVINQSARNHQAIDALLRQLNTGRKFR